MPKIEHVDAHDFTRTDNMERLFGVTARDTAGALCKLADDVEAGNVLLQRVTQTHELKYDEFAMTTLALTYARRHHKEEG